MDVHTRPFPFFIFIYIILPDVEQTQDFTIAHPDDLDFQSDGEDSCGTSVAAVDTLSELSTQASSSSVKPQTQKDVTLMRCHKQGVVWKNQSEVEPKQKTKSELLALSMMLKKSLAERTAESKKEKSSSDVPPHASWLCHVWEKLSSKQNLY